MNSKQVGQRNFEQPETKQVDFSRGDSVAGAVEALNDHHPQGIENEASLLESGIVDSLGILEIVNYLVESHGINIDEDDLIPDNFNSIRSIAELILKKREDFSN